MNSYDLSRKWFNWCFDNPEKINPNHSALYFFCIEHCNRLGWKEKFALPTTMTKEAIGIHSYNTYIKTLNDLINFGFIILIEKSKNQYSSNIIALSNFNKASDKASDKALDKALDKAFIKHATKQVESTQQSNYSINKQITNKQRTNNNEQINNDVDEGKTLHLKLKNVFLEFYKLKNKTSFYWTGKDGKNLKLLINKIIFSLKDENIEIIEKNIIESFELFLNEITDKWILDNLSISIINSKYNEILNKLKNGKKTEISKNYKQNVINELLNNEM